MLRGFTVLLSNKKTRQELPQVKNTEWRILYKKEIICISAHQHSFLNAPVTEWGNLLQTSDFDKSGHWLRMWFNSPQLDEMRGKHQWCPWITRQNTFVFIPPCCGCVPLNSCVCVSVPAETHHKLPNYVLFHYQSSFYCHANMQNCLEWIQSCNV